MMASSGSRSLKPRTICASCTSPGSASAQQCEIVGMRRLDMRRRAIDASASAAVAAAKAALLGTPASANRRGRSPRDRDRRGPASASASEYRSACSRRWSSRRAARRAPAADRCRGSARRVSALMPMPTSPHSRMQVVEMSWQRNEAPTGTSCVVQTPRDRGAPVAPAAAADDSERLLRLRKQRMELPHRRAGAIGSGCKAAHPAPRRCRSACPRAAPARPGRAGRRSR